MGPLRTLKNRPARLPALFLIFVLGFGMLPVAQVFAGGPGSKPSQPDPITVGIFGLETSVANVATHTLLVKWKTTTQTKGRIAYGTRADKLDQLAYDARGADGVGHTHNVLIKGTSQGSTTFFIILVDGQRFDNGGQPFQISPSNTAMMAALATPVFESQSTPDFKPSATTSTPVLAPNTDNGAARSSPDTVHSQPEVLPTTVSQEQPILTAAVTIPAMKLPWSAGTQQFTGGPHGGATNWTCNDLRSVPNMSGLDFGMPSGTDVLATAAGKVVYAAWYDNVIGYAVGIDHGGNFGTRYWHLSSIDSSIKVGVSVTQGQFLGKSGAPPNLPNNFHLHLEFRQWNGTDWNTPYPAHGIQIDGYTARAFIRSADGLGYNYQGTLTRGTETVNLTSYCNNQIKTWTGSAGTVVANANGGAPVVSTNVKNTGGQAAVTIQQAYTTDGNGNAKTTFAPGDQIRYNARVNNSGSSSVTAALSWLANGSAQLASWSGNLSIAAGASNWYLSGTIPSNAPGGTYTLRVQSTYNGATSQATSIFTVVSVSAVTIQQVYTTDGNGNAKTTFAPGDQIRYNARVNNSGSSSVTAALSWLANGPAQIASWSGNLSIAAGASILYLGSNIPSNAPGGTYTLRVQSTYNGATSQATANFTVSQNASEVVVDELSSGFSKSGQYWWDDTTRGFNGHMYWTYVNGSVVSSSAIWRPSLPAGRSYEVFAYIPDYHTNTTNARYEIHYSGGGTTTVSRQQAPYSSQWISLGTYSFDAGTSGYVRLTDATGESAGSKQIGFDALKWVPR